MVSFAKSAAQKDALAHVVDITVHALDVILASMVTLVNSYVAFVAPVHVTKNPVYVQQTVETVSGMYIVTKLAYMMVARRVLKVMDGAILVKLVFTEQTAIGRAVFTAHGILWIKLFVKKKQRRVMRVNASQVIGIDRATFLVTRIASLMQMVRDRAR